MNWTSPSPATGQLLAGTVAALVLGGPCSFIGQAWAQQQGQRQAVTIEPSLTVELGYSDVKSSETLEKTAGMTTRVSPRLQVRSRSGSIVGSLDYSLSGLYYQRDKSQNTEQNALAASFVAEAVPSFFYVDGRANITQQAISAAGQINAPGSFLPNDNLTEVLNVSLSPYVRGVLGGVAEYEVRLTAGGNKGRKTDVYDSNSSAGSFSLRSAHRGARVGWSLSGSQQRVDFRAGRTTENTRASASVSYLTDVDLLLTLRGGQEITDVGSFQRRRYDNWGGGLRWTPTPRTLVSIDADRRYFGTGHQITVEHRWRRTLFRFSSNRDATNSSDASGVSQPVTLYALYFAQFASIEPDPVARDALVRALLNTFGLDPSAVVAGGALTSAVSLQRRDDLSMVYTGQRATVTVLGFRNASRIIDNPLGLPDQEPLRIQHGLSATLSYRLTRQSSLTVNGFAQRTLATTSEIESDLRSLSVGLTTAINPHMSTNLLVRYSDYEGAVRSTYSETSYLASLTVRF